MHVCIIFAHPSEDSFSRSVLTAFTKGLKEAGHSFEVSDLYRMGFKSEMDSNEYHREIGLNPEAPVPKDVEEEQKKIDRSDALAFIFPVWWSDCPAKCKGWFDRVFTYGYAYFYDEDEERHTRINIKKAVVICSAGHTEEHLEETGIAESMRRIILGDRLLGVGVKEARMEILGGMMPKDKTFQQENLKKAYDIGRNF
ncbi:MAG: NAD(P)H-dependent oxidoreductase [Candidatus Aminicenantes bacterium]|nr:NAD(P)H-dependent oxidoreductase [Candidatus Aminicenantes bacterium]